MESLSSKARILRTVSGQPVDRVPIFAPLPWHPLVPEPNPDDWKAQPNYRELVSLASEHCDFYATLDIPERTSIGGVDKQMHGIPTGLFDRRFLMIPPDRVQVTQVVERADRRYIHYRVDTPQGALTTTDVITLGVDTVWTVEPLIKEAADVAKVLSVPYRFDPPDLAGFLDARQRLGDQGVPVVFVSSPLVMVSRMMEFESFLLWTVTERPLIERLMCAAQVRTAERLQFVLDNGVGPIIRFGGCEQATPPMMSGQSFDDFIVKYEAPLWQMVRQAGQIVWVHCHGKVATVVEKFVDLGVQMLDPVEPPPQGDITIDEAKERAAHGPMTLVGNVEGHILQFGSSEQVEREVERAICNGGRKHFILAACDVVAWAVDDQLRDNLVRFIRAGVKFGAF